MSADLSLRAALPPASPELLSAVRAAEAVWLKLPQVSLTTEHLFHAGMYARTIRIKADHLLTGVLIKRATILVISGSVLMLTDSEWVRFDGYNVVAGSAGRKPMFAVLSDSEFTMLFPTDAKTVEEAQAEFTDEADQLLSIRPTNHDTITITGE
jgi:hypothetical protein